MTPTHCSTLDGRLVLDHRRPDARSLRHRPRRSHFSRSARSGGAVRPREYRLGGAANVAHNVAALGGRVEMVGLAGEDAERRAPARTAGSARHRHRRGSSPTASRRTTRKLRVVTTRNQQVARIDYERRSRGGWRRRSGSRRPDQGAVAVGADAMLVSDYLKGAVSRAVAAGRRRRGTSAWHSGADRSEGSTHRLLPRRNAHHAEPSRSRSRHAHADSHQPTRPLPRHAGSVSGPAAMRFSSPAASTA